MKDTPLGAKTPPGAEFEKVAVRLPPPAAPLKRPVPPVMRYAPSKLPAGGVALVPSWHCRPVTLKKTILPSAAVTIPVPAERAQTPPAPFGPRIVPKVELTSYVPLPMWSPVALPLMVQVMPDVAVHCPAPSPMTCQSSTLSAAAPAGVTVEASPTPSTSTKANNDFADRNITDIPLSICSQVRGRDDSNGKSHPRLLAG